jgi:aspartyl-tRNA(Asn)/glutamyl-tRNA(Gln) amidotransferase subunit A
VGLKPTYGLVSKFGVTAHAWSLDTCGPLARTVRDVALVLEVLAGHDPRDPSTSVRPVETWTAALTGDVGGIRVGVPQETFWERLDPEVESLVRTAIARLEELGAKAEPVGTPWVEHAAATNNVISWVEASVYHAAWKDRWAEYDEEMQQRALMGQVISGADYLLAQQVRREIVARARRCFDRVDVLATPTCPVPAPSIDSDTAEVGASREPVRSVMGRLTRIGSLTGFPSLAVPCGFTRSGLPVSLHLMAAPFHEATVLRLGHAYEQAAGWHKKHPRL